MMRNEEGGYNRCPVVLRTLRTGMALDSTGKMKEERGEGDLNPRSLSGTGLAIQRLTGLGYPRSGGAYERIGDKGFRRARREERVAR